MAYARSTVDRTDVSIVDYLSSNGGSKCGYCNSAGTGISNGMWAYEMTVKEYQALIDRGWRRCGNYLYKPSLKETCCALYTIKCGALDFKLSKSQKKILKKMNRFLANDERFKSKNDGENKYFEEGNIHGNELLENLQREPRNQSDVSIQSVVPLNSSTSAEEPLVEGESSVTKEQCHADTPKPCDTHVEVNEHEKAKVTEKKTYKPGVGADVGRPPCKKAKLIRLEKKKQKLQQSGDSSKLTQQPPKQQEKSLEDFLKEPESVKHRLRVRLVRSHPVSDALESTFNEEWKLYQRYQVTIHGDPISKCTESSFRRFLVTSPLQIDLVAVASLDFQATFKESSEIFAKYQKSVHHEMDSECGPDTFSDFLESTPLKPRRPRHSVGSFQGYGSFHQQYWLDDKLIAVGVLDILPDCVSSVYFFYDPDYGDLSLGTYGALREVAFVRELYKYDPDLRWYYMGFYIHTCPKMRYKAGFLPSYLLCPEVYNWHPVEKCLPLLDKSKYSRFEPDPEKKDVDGDVDLDRVAILWKKTILSFKHYKMKNPRMSSESLKKVEGYTSLVGRKCAENMLLLIS